MSNTEEKVNNVTIHSNSQEEKSSSEEENDQKTTTNQTIHSREDVILNRSSSDKDETTESNQNNSDDEETTNSSGFRDKNPWLCLEPGCGFRTSAMTYMNYHYTGFHKHVEMECPFCAEGGISPKKFDIIFLEKA